MLAALVLTTPVREQAAEDASSDALVSDWFEAMNALDGSDASIEALVALYREDAFHITAPESHQLGTVTFQGHDHIRVMAQRWSETYAEPRFRVEVVTARETSTALFHRADGPWGGAAVAVAFSAAFNRRADGARLMVPGAAFFQIEGEKIRQLRLYFASSEMAEVEPLN